MFYYEKFSSLKDDFLVLAGDFSHHQQYRNKDG